MPAGQNNLKLLENIKLTITILNLVIITIPITIIQKVYILITSET